MATKLGWIKHAFDRTIDITDGQQVIGTLHREVLSRDVEARLNNVHVMFDVTGFIFNTVNIHDLANNNDIIGRIEFSFGKRAELHLATGETYLWKRHSVLMHDWSLMATDQHEQPTNELIHYERIWEFFSDKGTIEVFSQTPNMELLILTGLFVRNYFLRRRRAAAAAVVAASK